MGEQSKDRLETKESKEKTIKTLLVCDLDRTVLPDGPHPVSENSMDMFKDFVKDNALLVYATGRSMESALNAIDEYGAPEPKFLICDLGTTMYVKKSNNGYESHNKWQEQFKKDWGNITSDQIRKALEGLNDLELQQEKDQGTFKASYYIPLKINKKKLRDEINVRLSDLKTKSTVLITENEIDGFSYLDIIPESATKLEALNFLVDYLNLDKSNVVYCGDSGNDLEPLVSGYKAIVVGNSSDAFKRKVKNKSKKNNTLSSIYFAKGGYNNMNGNYTSGIIEGLHYFGLLE